MKNGSVEQNCTLLSIYLYNTYWNRRYHQCQYLCTQTITFPVLLIIYNYKSKFNMLSLYPISQYKPKSVSCNFHQCFSYDTTTIWNGGAYPFEQILRIDWWNQQYLVKVWKTFESAWDTTGRAAESIKLLRSQVEKFYFFMDC